MAGQASTTAIKLLRHLAAMLVLASGTGQVAALWFTELNQQSVLQALLGSAYLMLGIGLLGKSRFSLVLGITVPLAAFTARLLQATTEPWPLQLKLASDALIVVLCMRVLWSVRHQASH